MLHQTSQNPCLCPVQLPYVYDLTHSYAEFFQGVKLTARPLERSALGDNNLRTKYGVGVSDLGTPEKAETSCGIPLLEPMAGISMLCGGR